MDTKFSITETEGNKLKDINENELYDVIITGGGPAGLTAAVYCIRKGIKTALITYNVGGQVIETASIENYMGYRYIEGFELVQKFREQIKQFELAFSEGYNITNINLEGNIKIVKLENGKSFKTKSLIIASGKSSRKLQVPGENLFVGKGVHYCAVCDAPFYKNKNVIVVGGGNSGVEAAIDLAKIAEHVTIIQYEEKLTADKILIQKVNEFNNIEYIYSSAIKKINGDSKVKTCDIINKKTNDQKIIEIDGIFVEIGLIPNTGFVKGLLELNEYNEIRIDSMCRTNIDGIFAAGDVSSVKYKQIIIAAGEGSKAALSCYEYLLKN
ncbi:MAG: FAD-dependent oxidoreductase [Spirochaetes bacterium]|nr:FAD-dependent oxidoreductase [Spirochaetota bacterium]